MSVKRDRVATSFLFFANGFGFGGWSASIAPLKTGLGLSNGELGLLLFTLAAGGMSLMPLAGVFAPKIGGAGKVAGWTGFAFALCFALAGIAPGAWTMALVGLAIGATNGLMDVSMNAHAAEIERRWDVPIMSSFHAAFSVGGLVGASFGAGALALGLGWRGLLIALAALVAAMIALARTGMTDGERQKPSGATFGWPPRALIGLAVVAMFCFVVEGSMIDWDGVYLVSLGVGPAAAPFGYAAFAATMILGRLFGDRVIARIGRLPAVIGGCVLSAMGLALACAVPHFAVAAVGFALVGAGLSNVVPALFSEGAARATSAARGIATVATAGYTGMLAGPPLVGAVASVSDLRVAFAVLAAMALVAAGLAARA